MDGDLRQHLRGHLEGIRVSTMRDGVPSGLMPQDAERIVDKMVDAIIDLAGQGQLLKSIDRLHR